SIHIGGTGFGPNGTANFGTYWAALSWSDHEIVVQVPNAPSGELTLSRKTSDRASFSAGQITIVPAAAGDGIPNTQPATGSAGAPNPQVARPQDGGLPTDFTLPTVVGSVPPPGTLPSQQLSAQQGTDSLTVATASAEGQVSSNLSVTVTLVV